MVNIIVLPAILLCSGEKKKGEFTKPFVKIVYPPNKKILARIGLDDQVTLDVPLIYFEATEKKDHAYFKLDVSCLEREWSESRKTTSKDKKVRFDKKNWKLEIPLPNNEATYNCKYLVRLKQEEWTKEEKDKKIKPLTDEGVTTIIIERKKNYVFEDPYTNKEVNDVVIVGIPYIDDLNIALTQEHFTSFFHDLYDKNLIGDNFWENLKEEIS